MDHRASFGEWLKRRREALGLTQKELAHAANCSLSSMRKIESGERRPSKQIAEQLALALEIAPEEQSAFVRYARARVDVDAGEGGVVPAVQDEMSARVVATAEISHTAPGRKRSATPPTNLHAPLTSFVGRKAELARVRSLLWRVDVRLLTLTGPPGIGKTRLSVELAASVLGDFEDGVFVVPLASVSDPQLVAPAIAHTLMLKESEQRSVWEGLRDWLADKAILLVLDNFEQVVEAGPTVGDLLGTAPRLKVVVTSRIPLHVYGEQEFAVPALGVPEAENHASRPGSKALARSTEPGAIENFEAVQLFVRRAQSVAPDFVLAEENAAVVGEICRKLDGLPLAIELAAAQSKYLSPRAILQRLEEVGQLGVLSGGPQDRTGRQQTMHEAVAWSYRLLDEREKRVFRRLGIFVGAFSGAAAEAVCDFEAGLDGVRGILYSLLDKSLLRQVGGVDGTLFGMLEVIREYAGEQLREAGEVGEARQRLVLYYLGLAEDAARFERQAAHAEWTQRLEAEHDNIRQAMGWATEGEAELGLRFGVAMSGFWETLGYLSEGRDWLARAVRAEKGKYDGEEPVAIKALRAGALDKLGRLAWNQGDQAAAFESFESSLRLAREAGDKKGIASMLNSLAQVPLDREDFGTAKAMYEEGLALSRELGDRWLIARSLNNLGNLHRNMANSEAARACYVESADLFRELGDVSTLVIPLGNLSLVCIDQEDWAAAGRYQDEAIAICREQGHKANLNFLLAQTGTRLVEEGKFAEAQRVYNENLALLGEIKQRYVLPMCLEGIASMRSAQGQALEAARFWGKAEALREELNLALPLPAHARYGRNVEGARKQAAADEFEAAWREGRQLGDDEVIALGIRGGRIPNS